MVSIKGNLETIISRLVDLKTENKPVWVEITLDDERLIPNVQEQVNKLIRDSPIDVLKITNTRVVSQVLQQMNVDDSLSDMNERDVFARCMEIAKVSPHQRQELIDSFSEILHDIYDEDLLSRGDLP